MCCDAIPLRCLPARRFGLAFRRWPVALLLLLCAGCETRQHLRHDCDAQADGGADANGNVTDTEPIQDGAPWIGRPLEQGCPPVAGDRVCVEVVDPAQCWNPFFAGGTGGGADPRPECRCIRWETVR